MQKTRRGPCRVTVTALDREDLAKEEQVADDEECDMLEVVEPLVLDRQVHQTAQVGERDEGGVREEREERVQHHRADGPVDERVDQTLGAPAKCAAEARSSGAEQRRVGRPS